jgi:hypothetical protein
MLNIQSLLSVIKVYLQVIKKGGRSSISSIFSEVHTHKKTNYAQSTFFTGQPIFNQILSLIPRNMVNTLVKEYKTDRYSKKFRSYDHLVTMLYSVFHKCSSLREVVTGMQAMSCRLTHLGVNSSPRRSTLADANEGRNADFFADLYHKIYQRYYGSLPDSLKGKKILNRLFIIDSTLISLFSTVMQSTGSYGLNGKKKGGVKAHVLARAQDNLPCFIRVTCGKSNDSTFLPFVGLPAGFHRRNGPWL